MIAPHRLRREIWFSVIVSSVGRIVQGKLAGSLPTERGEYPDTAFRDTRSRYRTCSICSPIRLEGPFCPLASKHVSTLSSSRRCWAFPPVSTRGLASRFRRLAGRTERWRRFPTCLRIVNAHHLLWALPHQPLISSSNLREPLDLIWDIRYTSGL